MLQLSSMLANCFVPVEWHQGMPSYQKLIAIEQGSFVRFIRGGGWLLAVFQRAFSYRQRWGLDMAQCAIPL